MKKPKCYKCGSEKINRIVYLNHDSVGSFEIDSFTDLNKRCINGKYISRMGIAYLQVCKPCYDQTFKDVRKLVLKKKVVK